MNPHRLRTTVWLFAAAAVLAPGLAAQERPRRPERPGFDFSSNGVWRNRARMVMANRAAALARGDMAQLNAALATPGAGPGAMAVSGVMRVPIFLVTPSNRPIPFPRQQYHDVLLGTTTVPYSVSTFYEELSNGLFSVQGQVFDWLTLANSDTFYEGPAGCNGLCGIGNMQELMREAIFAQEGGVDFGLFDNDGPDGLPNSGDDDGEVDVAVFVHSELGGECGTPNIWAHRFFYSGWGGGAYLTSSPRRDASSQPVPGQFIRIDNYTIQSGRGGATACGGGMMPIGTIAHETGHGLGLPDFYDTDPDDSDDSEGIGEWGLMGSGNNASPPSPSHMEGFSRLQLGWVTVRELTAGGTYELGPYTAGDTIFMLTPTVPNPRGEYLLLENRQAVLSDAAVVAAKAAGLLIWHVDPQRYQQGLLTNTVNSGSIHALALKEADGLANLRSSVPAIRNRGDAGDPWPGPVGQNLLSYNSNPASRLNNGAFAGFVLDSIRRSGQSILFRLTFPPPLVASDTALRQAVAGAAYSDTLRVSGGQAAYQFTIVGGALPTGLALGSSSGAITGIPTRDSTWSFTARASSAGVIIDLPLQMSVTAPNLVAQNVVNQLMTGGAHLTADQIRYLDLQGNTNGGLDLGDVVAWLDRTGTVLPAPLARILFSSGPR